jgi:hypothetical protein
MSGSRVVSRFKFGRRQLLKVGAASAGAGLLVDKWAGAPAVAGGGESRGSPYTTPFVEVLPTSLPKRPVAALTPSPQIPLAQTNADVRRSNDGRTSRRKNSTNSM